MWNVYYSVHNTYQAEVDDYYRGAGRRREEERDKRRARRVGKEQEQEARRVGKEQEQKSLEILDGQEQNKVQEENKREEQSLLTVLDVGSCYNPFGGVEDWEVTAVDIAPANSRFIVMPLSTSQAVQRVKSIQIQI